jgi:citrate synthase
MFHRPDNVPAFIEAVKKREKVLSGFGHRVYKTSDPRSFIVRKTADEVFKVYVSSVLPTSSAKPWMQHWS